MELEQQRHEKIKFLYSYGGEIIARRNDGKLSYAGGCTRILSVDRTITYSELMVKFGESCGCSMDLKCKLPTEDLVMVTIDSDEDLRCLFEEYEEYSPEARIRAVLFPVGSAKKVNPPSSSMSCSDFPSAVLPPPQPTAHLLRARPEANTGAVPFPIRSAKEASPPSSPISCFNFPSAAKLPQKTSPPGPPPSAAVYRAAPPCAAVQRPDANIRAVPFPTRSAKEAGPPSPPMRWLLPPPRSTSHSRWSSRVFVYPVPAMHFLPCAASHRNFSQ